MPNFLGDILGDKTYKIDFLNQFWGSLFYMIFISIYQLFFYVRIDDSLINLCKYQLHDLGSFNDCVNYHIILFIDIL